MSTKKYLSYDKLTEYDALIKTKIDEGDSSVLESAKSYTDGEYENVLSEATAYVDNQIETHSHTSILEINAGLEQKFWRGTKLEYDSIEVKSDDTIYIITDSTSGAVTGSGDMMADVYDPQCKATDIFAYVDEKVADKSDADHTHDDYATTVYVDDNFVRKSEIGENGELDLSIYETKEDASDKLEEAKTYTDEQIALIPTPDVSGQINAHDTSDTAHSNIRVLIDSVSESIPEALSELTEDSTHRTVTDAEKSTWNAKSDFSGSYNDLTDKPSIPSIEGLASVTYVDTELEKKSDSDHKHDGVYETVGTAQTKADAALESAKSYADGIKNDLLNGAGEAYDTLKELGELIDENQDAIEALEIVATGKADKDHTHDIYETKENSQTRYDEIINAKADWNQNDETAIDYIKNRPFYTISSGGSNAIVENVNFSIVEEYGYDGFPTNFILEESKIYEVVINDVSYTCEGKRLDAHICLGDYSLSWGESKNDEEPFLIEYYPSDYDTACCFTAIDIGEYTVSIYESGGASGETVVKIPEKYLPDTVATVTYVDEQIALIPTPDVSGQINAHNEDTNAHADIRTAIDTLGNEVDGKLSGKADSAHNHVIDDITNLQSAFYGVWQQTTAREIDEALDAGKVVFMKAGGALIPLSFIPDRSIISYYEFRAAEPAAMTDYANPFGYATRLYRILRDPNDLDTLIYDVSFPGNVTFSIPGHIHTAREIDDGILSSDRLPTVPVTKGGTGATTAAAARTNLDVYSKTDVDNALNECVNNITSIKETNKNLEQKFWRGTQAEYDAIETKDNSTMYIITDEGNDDSGSGAVIGNMQSSVYDPQGKATDIFAYIDAKIAEAIGTAIGGSY